MIEFKQDLQMAVEEQKLLVQVEQRPLPQTGLSENLSAPQIIAVFQLNQSPKQIAILDNFEVKKTPSMEQLNDPIVNQPQNHEQQYRSKFLNKIQILRQLNKAFLHFDEPNDTRQSLKENIRKLSIQFQKNEKYVWKQFRKFKKNIIDINDSKNLTEILRIIPATKKIVKLFEKYRLRTTIFKREQAIDYVNTHSVGNFRNREIQIILDMYLQENAGIIKKEVQLSEDHFIYKIYQGYTKNQNAILFFSDFYYFTYTEECISVGLICGQRGLQYQFIKQNSQSKKHTLDILLEKYWKKTKKVQKFVVVIGVHEILKQNPRKTNYNNQHELFITLQNYGASLFPLPRDQSHLNLAGKILQRMRFPNKKKQVNFFDAMNSRLYDEQKFYSRNLFNSYITNEKVKIEIIDSKQQEK